MAEYILTCCSTADMPRSFFETRNIPFVCFHFHMDDKQFDDDLGASMPFDQFYAKIAAGAMPTTSQVNVSQFLAFFEPFLKEGQDVLHISFSSGLSGSWNSACIARDELQEKYPDRKILVVDSLCASSGYGLFMDALADRRDAGASIDELQAWAEANKLNVHHWFFSTDLSHYKRGGRISATSALFGTLLGICPLLNMNFEGKLTPRRKVRGKQNVIHETVTEMEAHAQEGLAYAQKCFISNSACPADALAVATLIEEKFPKLNGKVQINSIGTVIGSHTGPGTVALYFFGDKRID